MAFGIPQNVFNFFFEDKLRLHLGLEILGNPYSRIYPFPIRTTEFETDYTFISPVSDFLFPAATGVTKLPTYFRNDSSGIRM